jgi:hypothetical protein
MTTTTNQRLADLMPQLRDILHLPEDLDLPYLAAVKCSITTGDDGWTVQAQMRHRDYGTETWEALSAWAAATGGELVLGEPYPSSSSSAPSGKARKVSLAVVVGGVHVEVWDAVDSEFIPPSWCCAESYQLKDACADCKATDQRGPVHVTGAAVPLLIGGDEQIVTPVDSTYSDPAVRAAVHAAIIGGSET